MAKKIYRSDDTIGMGVFSLPVLTFVERFERLKTTNPQLDEQGRAAVAYFGMLAEQPEPSRMGNGVYIDETFNSDIGSWPKIEHEFRYTPFGAGYLKFIEDDVVTAYYKQVKRLQDYISYNALNDGIEKTLMEQKRKLAGLRAGIAESKAQAARALALSQITDEMTDEARFEAAEAQAKAQKNYDEAIARETELEKQLDNISRGLPADFGSTKTAGEFPILLIIAGGALLYWLGTRKGKRG